MKNVTYFCHLATLFSKLKAPGGPCLWDGRMNSLWLVKQELYKGPGPLGGHKVKTWSDLDLWTARWNKGTIDSKVRKEFKREKNVINEYIVWPALCYPVHSNVVDI